MRSFKFSFSILLFFFLVQSQVKTQNLIPNPSFELVNICKKYEEPCSPKGWRTTTLKLPRYNDARDQPTNLGSRSINLLIIDKARKFDRKFIQTALICPIEAGQSYQLSFYVKSKTPIAKELHLLLSNEMYLATTNKQMQGKTNFLIIPLPRLKKELVWEKVTFEFVATADATHLLIGNLKSDEETKLIDLAPKKKKVLSKKYEQQSRVEYAFDNVVLVPLDSNSVVDCDFAARTADIFTDHIRHQLLQELPKKISPNSTADFTIDTKEKIVEILEEEALPMPEVFSKSINILEGVEFVSNTTRLTSNSYVNLDEIRNALIDFPTIKIKIIGHTDDVGAAANNLRLSAARAKSIYDYLITEGIQQSRLSYDGRGETVPVAPNDSEGGRQINRRVEIQVIE